MAIDNLPSRRMTICPGVFTQPYRVASVLSPIWHKFAATKNWATGCLAVVLLSASIPSNGAALMHSGRCWVQAYLETGACNYDGLAGSEGVTGLFPWQSKAAAASAFYQVRPEYGNVGVNVYTAITAYDQSFASATSQAAMAWSEEMSVHSKTLARGTPVKLRWTHKLNYSITLTPEYAGELSIVNHAGSIDAQFGLTASLMAGGSELYRDSHRGSDVVEEFKYSAWREFDTYVGASLASTYSLAAYCSAYVSQPTMNTRSSTGSLCIVNAGNSGHIYFDVLTEGASLLTASGTDYSSPSESSVPEPNTFALAGLGLLGLLSGLRKRRLIGIAATNDPN